MKILSRICSTLFLLSIAWTTIYAQQIKVSGKVVDDTNEMLPGVTISIKGTTVGTITGNNGVYSLTVPDKSAILVFSFIGFKNQEVLVGDQSVINIQLEPTILNLDEVIAVGYGTQKKSDITGAVASLDLKTLEERPQTNLTQALQGNIAGVNVTTSAASAEDNASILIRGQNSITASNNPLIVLDGIPYSGGLGSISPNDVASIEILKDASSSAIYGARGANGVILVSTKQGKKGKTKLSYNGIYSFDEIAHLPDMQDASDFWAYRWERGVTNPTHILGISSHETLASRISQAFSGNETNNTMINAFMQGYPGQTWDSVVNGIISKYDPYTTDYETLKQIAAEFAFPAGGRNTDWVDLATRLGHKQRHNVALSGGTEQANYYTSVDYNNVEGIAVGDDYKSVVFRINLNLKIRNWIKFGTNTHIGFYDRSGSAASFGGSGGAFLADPTYFSHNEDGSISSNPDPENVNTVSPLEPLLYDNSDLQKRITTNNFLDIDIPFIKNLQYRLNTGYLWSNRQKRSYKDFNTVAGRKVGGLSSLGDNTGHNWTIENVLTYKKELGLHNIFATALYSAQESLSESGTFTGKGYANDVRSWYQYNDAETKTASQGYSKSSHLSQMIRLNYGYNSRYLLTATARRDGYSAFGDSKKFGVFPSVALGWNIANESFAKNWDVIDVLKLRASWGINGNEAVSAYSTLPTMAGRNYIDEFGNVLYGYYPSKLQNPDLGWETTESYNLGLDFALIRGRIRGALETYKSATSDLLLNETISAINGTTKITRNIGETSNYGIELQLSTVNIDNRTFSWRTDFNCSTFNTEIVNVGLYDEEGNPMDDIASGWFIGHPVATNYDYVFDRVLQKSDFVTDENGDYVLNIYQAYQLREEVANEVVSYQAPFPGKPIVKDIDGNGIIDGDDRQIIGDRMPDFIAGLTNTFKYKNLTFSFFLNGVWGITRRNDMLNVLQYGGTRRMGGVEFWTPENGATDMPGVNLTGTVGQNLYVYQKANYVRIQDITLSYDLPQRWLSAIAFNDLTAFVNIKNAHTFTEWDGLDPEYSGVAGIPRARSYVLGLRFSF